MLIKAFLLLAAATLLSAGRVPHVEKRIVGGQDARIEDNPWQVYLLRSDGFYCGGSIYSKDFIITAAHCVEAAKPKDLQVRVGSSNRIQGGTVHQVAKIKQHPGFSFSVAYPYDIAVIRLSEPLIFNDKVQSIPLADEEPWDGTKAWSTGWGNIWKDGFEHSQDILQGVEIPIISRWLCKMLHPYYYIGADVICAGDIGKSTANGDSGGPLTVNNELVGVVSGGLRGLPSVYASVAYYKDWILNEIELLS